MDPEHADANGGWLWNAIFLDQRGRKRLTPSGGRVWRWLAATAAATEVAATMVMVFCVGRLRCFLVLGERRGEKLLVKL
jgi:hypothetical protein